MRCKFGPVFLAIVTVASPATFAHVSHAAPAAGTAPARTSELDRLLADADRAEKAGNLNLAIIQLKNAALSAPGNGEVRARLGIALFRNGQAADAERELRQARKDGAPPNVVIPAILRTMLRREKMKELLAEFPDPPQTAIGGQAADILAARALALQALGKPQEARTAMNRSLAGRKDADGLVTSANLAQAQGDLGTAGSQLDEALKLSPANEDVLAGRVRVALRTGDLQRALANADDYVTRLPGSAAARISRIGVLFDLDQNAKASSDIAVLLKLRPDSPYADYFRAILMSRARDSAGARAFINKLAPEFVQSQPPIARTVAGIAQASGDLEQAGAILAALVAHHPDDRLSRIQLASVRLIQQNPQAALTALDPLKDTDDASVQALLAQAYLGLQQFDRATAALEVTNKSANPNPLLLEQLALVELQTGENDRSIRELRDLLRDNPDNVQLAAALIAALERAAKWDEALKTADELGAKAPNAVLPPFYRGEIQLARGRPAEAAAAFGRAIALDPKFLPALYYRAIAWVATGESGQAKKDLQSILAEAPDNMPAYLKLIEIAADHRQDQEALALFERAIQAAPKNPAPRIMLTRYLIARGKYQEAQAAGDALLKAVPDSPDGMALRGQIQALRGQTADAVRTIRSLTSSAKKPSPGAYAVLASALYAAHDEAGAEEAARRAIELNPRSIQTRMQLIEMQIAAAKPDNALASARAYASAYPGTDGDLLLGDTLLRLNRADEAEALLDRSLGTKPDARIVMMLSQIALRSHNEKKAVAVVNNWIRKNPADIAMRQRHAELLMQSGDLTAAGKEYELLVKEQPDDPQILNNLGWILQKDDPVRALSLVSLAAKIAPQSAEIADTLGWLQHQRGDAPGALATLRRAHDLNAGNPLIAYHLAVALDATGQRAAAKSLLQATLAKNPDFDGAAEAGQLLSHW